VNAIAFEICEEDELFEASWVEPCAASFAEAEFDEPSELWLVVWLLEKSLEDALEESELASWLASCDALVASCESVWLALSTDESCELLLEPLVLVPPKSLRLAPDWSPDACASELLFAEWSDVELECDALVKESVFELVSDLSWLTVSDESKCDD
jgi:hypothetical protein